MNILKAQDLIGTSIEGFGKPTAGNPIFILIESRGGYFRLMSERFGWPGLSLLQGEVERPQAAWTLVHRHTLPGSSAERPWPPLLARLTFPIAVT